MGATALLMAATEGDIGQQAVIIAALLGVLRLTWLLLLGATGVARLLRVTGLHVVSRGFGVLTGAVHVRWYRRQRALPTMN